MDQKTQPISPEVEIEIEKLLAEAEFAYEQKDFEYAQHCEEQAERLKGGETI